MCCHRRREGGRSKGARDPADRRVAPPLHPVLLGADFDARAVSRPWRRPSAHRASRHPLCAPRRSLHLSATRRVRLPRSHGVGRRAASLPRLSPRRTPRTPARHRPAHLYAHAPPLRRAALSERVAKRDGARRARRRRGAPASRAGSARWLHRAPRLFAPAPRDARRRGRRGVRLVERGRGARPWGGASELAALPQEHAGRLPHRLRRAGDLARPRATSRDLARPRATSRELPRDHA